MLHQSLGAYISVSVYTSLSTSLDSSSLGVNHCSLFWLMFIELKQKREAHQRIKAEERGAAKYEDSTGDQYVYIHGSWDRGRSINEGRFLKTRVLHDRRSDRCDLAHHGFFDNEIKNPATDFPDFRNISLTNMASSAHNNTSSMCCYVKNLNATWWQRGGRTLS